MSNVEIAYHLLVFIVVFILGIAFSLPSFLQSERGAKINLGLDLQDGLYILLGVDNKEAVRSKMKSVTSSFHYSINKENILIDQLIVRDEGLEFGLLDEDDMTKIQALLDEIKGLNVQKGNLRFAVSFTQRRLKNIENFALLQAVETIRNRLNEFGLVEPTVAKQGEDKILVGLAGIKTKEGEPRTKERIIKAAHLQLMEVDESEMSKASAMSEAEAASYGLVLMSDSRNENLKYTFKNIPISDGSMLTDAGVGFSDTSTYLVISFTLNSEGAKKFADYMGANVGKHLAIVLDNKVYSAPSINERISGDGGQISGAFIREEARDVAVVLRSGTLLAPVKLLEQRSIGPSLGADNIKTSMTTLIGASIFIIVFMMLYYGVAGVFANIAMLVNVLVIVAVMAMFGATLTLPGMAGLVLAVGMTVDTNVITNECIKELLCDRVKIRASVEQGYKNAISAIIGANITSLVTSVALYAYGTDAVKGFAVALGIGIVVSMITAIWGTHGMFDYFMHKIEKSNNTRFWFGYKRRI